MSKFETVTPVNSRENHGTTDKPDIAEFFNLRLITPVENDPATGETPARRPSRIKRAAWALALAVPGVIGGVYLYDAEVQGGDLHGKKTVTSVYGPNVWDIVSAEVDMGGNCDTRRVVHYVERDPVNTEVLADGFVQGSESLVVPESCD